MLLGVIAVNILDFSQFIDAVVVVGMVLGALAVVVGELPLLKGREEWVAGKYCVDNTAEETVIFVGVEGADAAVTDCKLLVDKDGGIAVGVISPLVTPVLATEGSDADVLVLFAISIVLPTLPSAPVSVLAGVCVLAPVMRTGVLVFVGVVFTVAMLGDFDL